MTQDAETIIAIAALAAQADGQQDDNERTRIVEMAAGLGLSDASTMLASSMAASVTSGETCRRFSFAVSLSRNWIAEIQFDPMAWARATMLVTLRSLYPRTSVTTKATKHRPSTRMLVNTCMSTSLLRIDMSRNEAIIFGSRRHAVTTGN